VTGIHPTWLIILGGTASYLTYKVAPARRRGTFAIAAGIGSAAALYATGWFTGRDPVPPMAGFPMAAQVRLP
jgi:hypothetical protein